MYFDQGLIYLQKSFLSYSDLPLPTHCRCRELLLHLITLNDTHTRWDSSGRHIGPLNTALPDNTQHSQKTKENNMFPAGFEH